MKPAEIQGEMKSPEEMAKIIREQHKEIEYLKRQREILKKSDEHPGGATAPQHDFAAGPGCGQLILSGWPPGSALQAVQKKLFTFQHRTFHLFEKSRHFAICSKHKPESAAIVYAP
jgi:hypothetical protein